MEHHKLDAYNVALDFVPRAHTIAGGVPRGLGDLADQLRRASTSIALNIAEGASTWPLRSRRGGPFTRQEPARIVVVTGRNS